MRSIINLENDTLATRTRCKKKLFWNAFLYNTLSKKELKLKFPCLNMGCLDAALGIAAASFFAL